MKIPPIGLQLYTVRNSWASDPAGTLRRLAEIGYEEVELFFHELDSTGKIIGIPAKELAGYLKETGLRVCGVMAPGGPATDWDTLIQYNLDIGSPGIVIGVAFFDSIAAAYDLAKWLNEKAELCARYGLTLSYHHHFHEFQELEGEVIMDVLMREARILFEVDTFWVSRAGLDPVEFIRKNGSRIGALHIKDQSPSVSPVNLLEIATEPLTQDVVFSAAKPGDFVEVGTGCIDIAGVLAEAVKFPSIQHVIVEQDQCAGDQLTSAATSFAHLKKIAASLDATTEK